MKPLLIIDPSTHVAEHEAVHEVASVWGEGFRVWRPAMERAESPQTVEASAGVVILGSRASVVDSLEWLDKLRLFLKPLIQGEVIRPVLGICFGHQLLCHMLGGEVGYLTPQMEKKVAVETTTFIPSRWCRDGGRFPVVCSHREVVTTVEKTNLVVIASRSDVQIDAVEHRTLPLFGCQFHPEARLEFGQNCGLDLQRHLPRLQAAGRELIQSAFQSDV